MENPSNMYTITLSCSWCKVFCNTFSAFMALFLIIFPWVIEIILITQQTIQQQVVTMLVCGSLQTITSIFSAFMMAIQPNKDKDTYTFSHHVELDDGTCCWPPTTYKSLLNPYYVLCVLIPWLLTNMIISWVLNSHNQLPIYVHIMIYIPLLIFFPILFTSCAFIKSINNEYKEIAQISPEQ